MKVVREREGGGVQKGKGVQNWGGEEEERKKMSDAQRSKNRESERRRVGKVHRRRSGEGGELL
jgi:hypothetical protein